MPRTSRWSRLSRLIALTLVAATLLGCGQRRAAATTAAGGAAPAAGGIPTDVEGEPAKVEERAAAFETAAVAADTATALSLVEGLEVGSVTDEAFTPLGTAPLGQKLAVLGGTAVAVIDGERHEMLRVRTDAGLEGYVPSSYVARNAALAVVVSENAALYGAPEEGAARAELLPAGTVVAAGVDTRENEYPSVAFVSAGTRRAFWGVYLRKADLSFRQDDVGSAILMRRAAASSPAEASELLKQALREHPSSHFVVRIEEAVAALAATSREEPAAQERAAEPFFASLVTTEENVQVRSSPDETAGEVVGTLAMGSAVEVEAKTTNDYAIGELISPWYRIREPRGWVYGAYVGVE